MTLVEILIALFVFMIGVLGVLSMYPVAMYTAGQSMGQMRANILARSALAQINTDCQAVIEQGVAQASSASTLVREAGQTLDRSDHFVTLISGPGKWQSRLITGSAGTTLDVCPDWDPVWDVAGAAEWTGPAAGDQYVVTRLGLPAPRRGVVNATGTSGSQLTAKGTTLWDANEWDGYTVVVLDDPNAAAPPADNAVGQQRVIVETQAPNVLQLDSAWTTAPSDDATFAIVNMNPRNGVVRDVTGSQIQAGVRNGASVDPLNWTEPDSLGAGEGFWRRDAVVGSSAASGMGVNTLVDSTATWTADEHRGRLVVITQDANDPAEHLGQVRLITGNTATDLSVYPEWDSVSADPTNLQYAIREDLGHFLVLTSDRPVGRVFRITAHDDDTDGDLLDCNFEEWEDIGVKTEETTFSVIGGHWWITSLFPHQDGEYNFNSFGRPKGGAGRQVANDVYFTDTTETLGSDYNLVAVFSDSGALADGPVRLDVFVYRNFNNSESLGENRKPVGYMTGYIGRPLYR